MIPKPEEVNLITGKSNFQEEHTKSERKETKIPNKPVSHWRARLTLNILADEFIFDGSALPSDVHRYMKIVTQGKTVQYLPILFLDLLSNRVKDLMVINGSVTKLPLTISYDTISLGKLRFWIHMQDAVYSLQQFGFTEKDVDEVKGIFVDTNLYFLALTFFVAAFHLLFDFLAFKNDISFWKGKTTMVGMSTKAVLWRCFSTIVIFLFLLDEQTSLLVLVPSGIGALIEVWKVKKAFKMSILWKGLKPTFQFGTYNESEKKTEKYDTQAMHFLSYILYPLCIGGAVYSLLYVSYKSWYSWLINSLVNGVYAFGFLFMLPQLFVNYKLKSVAHLPWKAFMYKAFNTFIDDIFAFIITMPTSHRLACFRDDVVFVIYLYQKWLYPVDKSRVNEYGQSYEKNAKLKAHID
nr:PREDICTED: cleft lip and palate transmembrane protein 1-like protein [Latimeria chalumnae]|eukprot:XP_014349944.1 PREDICTED: cleft lip and palate transmembrane protein 1-like protein [Latimeria chalumnae]